MKKFAKRFIFFSFLLIIIVSGVHLLIGPFLEHKISEQLSNQLFSTHKIQHGKIYVDIHTRKIFIESIHIDEVLVNQKSFAELTQQITPLKSKANEDDLLNQDHQENTVQVAGIYLEGISLYQLLFRKKIVVDELRVTDLFVKLNDKTNLFELLDKQDQNQSAIISIDKLFVRKINVGCVNIEIQNEANHKVLDVDDMSLFFSNVEVTPDSLSSGLPFTFEGLSLSGGETSYRLSEFEKLNVRNIELSNDVLKVNGLTIKTIFSRSLLSKHLKFGRDHINLHFPEIVFHNFEYGIQDSTFELYSSKIEIIEPQLHFYRDRFIKRNPARKPLYSELIRNLPFNICVDSAQIKNGIITYEENSEGDVPHGKINFKKFNANISNLSNTYELGTKETIIVVDAVFMNKTRLKGKWSFDVQDEKDNFLLTAQLNSVGANIFDNFARDHINMSFEGNLFDIFIRINGNDFRSKTDMKLSYKDFKVRHYKRNNKKNWITTTLANIYASNSSDDDGENVEVETERAMNRTFFNFIWISIRDALKEVFT
ncbi:MAG: hypothetical protein EA358_08050 [Flavobacteriales bacterium]|nr:MAG: hypothetical protein EA358_08050 [Flavobacteriales bacterium]